MKVSYLTQIPLRRQFGSGLADEFIPVSRVFLDRANGDSDLALAKTSQMVASTNSVIKSDVGDLIVTEHECHEILELFIRDGMSVFDFKFIFQSKSPSPKR